MGYLIQPMSPAAASTRSEKLGSSRFPAPGLVTTPRGGPRLVALALVSCLAGRAGSPLPYAVAAPGESRGAAGAELHVERTEDALECPDGAALTARIERILQRSLSADATRGASVRVAVRFRHADGTYVAELDFRGTKEGVRVLTDRSRRCEPLSEAVGVAIALVLDRELEPPATSPPEDEPLVPVREVRRSPSNQRDGTGHAAQNPPPPDGSGREAHVLAGGGVATGFGPSVSPVLATELSLTIQRWVLAGSFGYLPPSRSEYRGGGVESSLVMGSVSGCWHWLTTPVEFGPCGSLGVGRLRGRGIGYDEDRTHDMLWTAVAAGAAAQQRLWSPWIVGATAKLWIPTRRQGFAVENGGSAWQTPTVSFWFELLVGVSFR